MKYSNLFLGIAILGMVLLIAVKLFDDTSERTSRFVKACTDYSLSRVQQSCQDLGIDSFQRRRPGLEKNFTDYCACLAGVWRTSGTKLRPEFFANARQPQSQHTPDTIEALAWSRTPPIRSEYAKCHNRSGINLNWIAEAHLEKKNPQTPGSPAGSHYPRRDH
jgi:hypothetical protein